MDSITIDWTGYTFRFRCGCVMRVHEFETSRYVVPWNIAWHEPCRAPKHTVLTRSWS